jgi:hypothetical protein
MMNSSVNATHTGSQLMIRRKQHAQVDTNNPLKYSANYWKPIIINQRKLIILVVLQGLLKDMKSTKLWFDE